MVEGLPGPDFAGLKADIKVRGRLRYRVVPEPLVCILRVVLLSGAYCPGRIFCVLKMCCGDIAGIFLVNSAEKCDLTRGVVLFSDHMWCNCVPVHGNCGF